MHIDVLLFPLNACRGERRGVWSSHPRELPPQVLTEPDVRVSPHPALLIEARPHSNDQCANISVCLRAIHASQWLARRRCPRRRLYFSGRPQY